MYEAWEDKAGCSITFITAESAKEKRANNSLSEKARLLHRIAAASYEEAMSLHYLKMGWEPYVPVGEPKPCPKACGAVFYPEGSGQCPNCGRIC